MEGLGVIEHENKVKFKLWTYSGDKIRLLFINNSRKFWFTYMDLVDTLYSLNFLVDVLLFTVEEYSYFTLEGEMYQDQDLAEYAN
jgi:hypothetical protein